MSGSKALIGCALMYSTVVSLASQTLFLVVVFFLLAAGCDQTKVRRTKHLQLRMSRDRKEVHDISLTSRPSDNDNRSVFSEDESIKNCI